MAIQRLAPGPFQPDWTSLASYRVPRWYEDAKFGIFVHWGPYAVPAFGSEWYPRMMYQQGSAEYDHHRATFGPHDRVGYKDLIARFHAERFDAGAWARLFRRAGARFVVPVAEHHDGFALYECPFSRWNSVTMGPRRDIMAEVAAAVRQEGLEFGVSSHRAEHAWFFNGGLAFPSDVQDPQFADLYGPPDASITDLHARTGPGPSQEFLDDWLARTCHLVEAYRPSLVFFDWWIVHRGFEVPLQRFAAHYYNLADAWGRGVVITSKYDAMPPGTSVYDVERAQLQGIRDRVWQSDTAVAKNSWGYTEAQDYKTATDLVHDLVDVVSKNGVLLLNIGPRADGTIPEGDERLLLAMGDWLACNGEAIYGSRPWKVFGEGPACAPAPLAPGLTLEGLPPAPEGAVHDHLRPPFGAEDVRFTRVGDVLYAMVLGWPTTGTLRLRSLSDRLTLLERPVARVSLLGHGPVAWRRDGEGLSVTLPEQAPGAHAWTLKIETV